MPRKPVISLIGPADASPAVARAAETLGAGIAAEGWTLVTGGRGGAMAAASRGAQQVGGHAVGLLPGDDTRDANPWLTLALPTGLGLGRNLLVVRAADVVLALGGRAGTLSELALAWQLGKPIVALDQGEGWAARLAGGAVDDRARPAIHRVTSPAEALATIRDILAASS